jgi:uncharacterized membrane protein
MTDRRLKWALIASLALNVAIAGVVIGALIKGPPPAPWSGIALWHYARALPEPYRADLGIVLRDNRKDWAGPREALRSQRAALATALVTEPYAPARVADILNREVALTGELAARGTALLLAQIDRMTPAERAAYAAALTAPRERRGGHDDRERRDDRDRD